MPDTTYKLAVIDFQLALLKELYKNNKIGEKEYSYSTKALEIKKNKLKINKDLIPVVLDIRV